MLDIQVDNQELVLTVSKFIELLNSALHEIHAKIIGEVIDVNIASSGHVYFTLKDKDNDAVIDCIMWRSSYRINGVTIKVGEEYLLTGNPNIYPQRGSLSFIAQTIEQVGEGALKKAYDELKLKLTREGLLTDVRKRKIPKFPHTIGIITSKQGAVIHDFLNNLGQKGYKIRFIDTRVEGKEAIFDLLNSFEKMKRENLDILIVMRGGGSLQSLAAFDNESVVRAIAEFPVPVLAAIGHHKDVPLSALIADREVSTPTAASNFLNSPWDEAEMILDRNTRFIFNKYNELLNSFALTIQLRREIIEDKFSRILHIFQSANQNIKTNLSRMQESLYFQKKHFSDKNDYIINIFKQSIAEKRSHMNRYFYKLPFLSICKSASQNIKSIWSDKITRSYTFALQSSNATKREDTIFRLYSLMLNNSYVSIKHCEELIHLNDPTRILNQGYSILTNKGRVVKYIKDVKIGDSLVGLLSDGEIVANIKSTRE